MTRETPPAKKQKQIEFETRATIYQFSQCFLCFLRLGMPSGRGGGLGAPFLAKGTPPVMKMGGGGGGVSRDKCHAELRLKSPSINLRINAFIYFIVAHCCPILFTLPTDDDLVSSHKHAQLSTDCQ